MTNSWQQLKLGELVENLDNLRVPVTRSKRNKGTIPYYGATGIVDYVDDYIFDEKLLLVGEDGADWSAFANTAYIIEGKSWVNNHAHVLRVTNADIDFLKEYLNYADLRQHTSGTTRGKLNKSDLMGIPINVPPQNIQEKIAAYFRILNKQLTITDIKPTQLVVHLDEKGGFLEVAILITPLSSKKDVIGAFEESKKLRQYYEDTHPLSPVLDTDTLTNIIRDRNWYWQVERDGNYKKLLKEWNERPNTHEYKVFHKGSKRCDLCYIDDDNYLHHAVHEYRKRLK